MAAQDTVNRVFRNFKRYSTDGLPNPPTNAPLPIGDPQSGVHNPKKEELRAALLAPITEATEQADRAKEEADRAETEADRGETAADEAVAAAAGVNLPPINPGDAGKQLYVTDEEDGYRLDVPASGGGNSVTPIQYGATGDGVTDDASALTAMLSSIQPGDTVDFLGKTYRCDSSLTLVEGVTYRNGTIDFSNLASSSTAMSLAGFGLSEEQALTSDRSARGLSINVADTSGYAEQDWVRIVSDALFEDTNGVNEAEFARVGAVSSGTELRLISGVCSPYNISDDARVYKASFAKGPKFKNMTFIGAGLFENQSCLALDYVEDALIEDCTFIAWEVRMARFTNSVKCAVRDSRFILGSPSGPGLSGLGYGIAIDQGCQWIDVEGCYFENHRHGVKVGGTFGVNRWIRALGNSMYGMISNGLDSHSQAEYVDFSHNLVDCVVDENAETTQDGIVCQGINFTCIGNTVRGARRIGILWQPSALASPGRNSVGVISNNTILNSGERGIFIWLRGSMQVDEFTVSGNLVDGGTVAQGIEVYAANANVDMGTITGNSLRSISADAIYLRNSGSNLIKRVAISGNASRLTSGGNAHVRAASDGNLNVNYLTILGNTWINGTYGFRGENTDRNILVANLGSGISTLVSGVGGNSTQDNNLLI